MGRRDGPQRLGQDALKWLGDELCGEVDAAETVLVDLCRDLVAARSVNPPGDTRAAAAVVRAFLAEQGLDSRIEAAREDMPSVVATCEGGEPGPHLVLNVHLDTMDAGDESAWTAPPYELTERDGRLYGLGMGNMKGAVAAMTLAFRLLAARRSRWPGRLTLTAVSDEVVFGPHGAAHLLAVRPELVGDGLLCGEGPGWLRMAVAEKGVLWLRLRAEAEGGHASGAVRGGTATTRLAALVTAVDALNGRVAALPAGLAGLDDDHADDDAEPAGAAPDPGRTLSANVGTLGGGTFVSQRAREAVAEVDVRLPPGLTADAVEAEVRAASAAIPGTRVERMKGWDANWTGLDSALVRAVSAAATRVRGTPPQPVVRLPASDASRWRALGVPAVCYGPQPTLSAGVDDYARRADVVDCAKVYATAALAFLTGGFR